MASSMEQSSLLREAPLALGRIQIYAFHSPKNYAPWNIPRGFVISVAIFWFMAKGLSGTRSMPGQPEVAHKPSEETRAPSPLVRSPILLLLTQTTPIFALSRNINYLTASVSRLTIQLSQTSGLRAVTLFRADDTFTETRSWTDLEPLCLT